MDIREVSFSYNGTKQSLNSISTQIEHGSVTTIICPNGCGKSTLLGVMSNNYMPSNGVVTLNEIPTWRFKPRDLAKQLAVVHQDSDAPKDMTVERLVNFGRLPHRSIFRDQGGGHDEIITWALECTNLLEKRNLSIDQLSGGEQQRVWIAMALAQKTPLLLLDEPTTYLDIYYQYDILDLIKRLNVEQGLTIVMVLHDINQAIRYSDYVIVMKEGQLIAKGKPQEIISPPLIKETYGVDVVVKEERDVGMYIVPVPGEQRGKMRGGR